MVLEDAYTPVEKITEKQSSRRCSAQCALRVVIGFNPIGCLDKDEGKKFLPVTTPSPSPSPSPSEKQSKSSKSGLTSSFETLLSSPRPQGNKDLQTVGLAIDSDREICRGRIPSHTQHKFEEGRPIAIAQSELHHSVYAQSKLQRLPSHKERPITALSQAPTKIFEGFVNGDLNVERCVFSFLSTCPETSEAQDDTLPLATMDFMDACFLCKRQLGEGRDIFMYKGDKAFCSEDCRYQQIVIDDRAERQEKFPCVALKTGKSVQSHRSNYRTKVLSASTAAAA